MSIIYILPYFLIGYITAIVARTFDKKCGTNPDDDSINSFYFFLWPIVVVFAIFLSGNAIIEILSDKLANRK